MVFRCSGWAIPGAVFPAWRFRSILDDRRILKAPEEGPVLRLQIGLEDVADLKADLERGLAAARYL